MGYTRINLWVRDASCNLLKNGWRMDLVIQKCNGTYLIDYDQELITNLGNRNPGYTFTPHSYMGHQCIKCMPPASKDINHLIIDVPSQDSYKFFARMCHSNNEWTNKVYVTAKCEETNCVSLLLNSENLCSRNDIFPIAIAAKLDQVDDLWIQDFMKVVKRVGKIHKADLVAYQNARIADLNDYPGTPPSELTQANNDLLTLINGLPEDPLCY